ncbi:MAG TPA: AtpZ/AtpI family protein [Rubrobacter sp.]|jgi:F0F1-type ATP synthase assembly protein I|nr:AtpZ/AtpI family protein [Rubrobacter sp.]
MPDTRPQRNQANGNYARFVGLGFTFMIIIAAFTAGGYLLDRLLGTLPLLLLVGLLLGFGVALCYLFVTLSRVGRG